MRLTSSFRLLLALVLSVLAGSGVAIWLNTGGEEAQTATARSDDNSSALPAGLIPAHRLGGRSPADSDDAPDRETVRRVEEKRYPPGFADHYSMINLKKTFDEHLPRAEQGETESMLLVADVIRNCVSVAPYQSWEQFSRSEYFQAGQVPANMAGEIKKMLDASGSDCGHIASQAPAGAVLVEWAFDWYKKAADEGNPVAKLELIVSQEQGSVDLNASLELLEHAIESGDYRAYYYASRLAAQTDEITLDPYNLTGTFWRYVGCVNHPVCNARVMRREMAAEYLPQDVEAMVEMAKLVSDESIRIDYSEFPTFEKLRGGS